MRDSAVLRVFRGRSGLLLAVAVAVVLCAPGLGGGLVADDYGHAQFMLDHLHGRSDSPYAKLAWWDMFDICGRSGPSIRQRVAYGTLPWWTSPDLKIAFLRPLAVASQYLDFLLWPHTPWLMHLHNVVLYALCVWIAGVLYQRFIGARALAGLAALLYAVDEAHADGTAWLADRNTLLTALFVLLALLAFDRARRGGSRAGRWLAPLALLAAHASSEGALAAWGYLGAYALCIDRAPPRARLAALAPLALITLAWVSLAAVTGFGVRGSGIYVDPRSHPLYFIAVTAERLPEVLRAQFTLPFEIERMLPIGAQHASALVSYAVLALMALCAIPLLRQSASARFFALGALGSALPVCAGGAEPRLLFLIGFGAHGLLAELIGTCLRALRSAPPARRALPAFVAGASLLLHGPLAVVTAPLTPRIWIEIHRQLRESAGSLPAGKQFEQTAYIILNANYYLGWLLVRLYHDSSGVPGPSLMHVLGTSLTPVRLTRLERNVIELAPAGGYLLEPTSKLVRSPLEVFRVGDMIPLIGPRVSITAVTPDGRPARIRADLLDAEAPWILWLMWNDRSKRYERIVLPEIGQSMELPGSVGPVPDVLNGPLSRARHRAPASEPARARRRAG
jgi:hypothetical protein